MSIFVVRHAKAGSRHDWAGDDRERPLSKGGRKQTAAITARLRGEQITGLWTSPYVRCVQTLEPLGQALGLEVHVDKRLAEGTPLEDVLALLGEVDDGAVLCSHGDVIPELINGLVRRGTHVAGEPDWRKGAIWVLSPPHGDGAVATARPEPPPA
jgi:8-oxo-dGTP diphosphatase